MCELLTSLRNSDPTSSELAFQLGSALHRAGESEALRAFLSVDLTFPDNDFPAEVGLAKLQIGAGFWELGARRLYRLFRARPTSSEAAGEFLSALLQLREINDVNAQQANFGMNHAIRLQSGGETWWVAVDEDRVPNDSWPELLPADHPNAVALLGLAVGATAVLRHGLGNVEVTVSEIVSLCDFAMVRAKVIISTSAQGGGGPVWALRARDSGTLSVDVLLRAHQEARQRVGMAFDLYRERPIAIATLACLIKSDPVSVFLNWSLAHPPLFVGLGTTAEREFSTSILEGNQRRYVLDLLTLADLASYGLLERVTELIGRPLVAQSQRTQLLQLQNFHAPSPRRRLIDALVHFVGSHCDVVPTLGPLNDNHNHEALIELLDNATVDAVLLCLERNAVLVSEDGVLRALARGLGMEATINVQPLLMRGRALGVVSATEYLDALYAKFARNHDFLSVGAIDLLGWAQASPHKVSKQVRLAVASFKRPTLDLESGASVVAQFLTGAAKLLAPCLVGAYALLCVEALKHGTTQNIDRAEQLVSSALQEAFGRNGRRLKAADRRAFGTLLSRRA